MTAPIEIQIDGQNILMVGTGPWRVAQNGLHSQEIKDSTGRVTNPTVARIAKPGDQRGTKTNANVTWASLAKTTAVVEAANAKLAEVTAA